MQRHPSKWSLSNNISALPTLNRACLSKPFMWLGNQNPPTERNACTVEGLLYRNYIKLAQVLVRKDSDTVWLGTVSPDGRGRPTLTTKNFRFRLTRKHRASPAHSQPKIYRGPSVNGIRAQRRTIQDGSCCVSAAHWNPANHRLGHNKVCFAVTMCWLFWNTRL